MFVMSFATEGELFDPPEAEVAHILRIAARDITFKDATEAKVIDPDGHPIGSWVLVEGSGKASKYWQCPVCDRILSRPPKRVGEDLYHSPACKQPMVPVMVTKAA